MHQYKRDMNRAQTKNYYPHSTAGKQENNSHMELVKPEANKVLKFSKNWNNKLHCKVFTTIRLHDDCLYKIGNLFDIDLSINNSTLKIGGTVKLINKKTFKLNQLNDFMAYLDTGNPAETVKKKLMEMYKTSNENTLFDYLLFQKY